MNFTLPYLLSIITFLPLVGALVVLVVPGDRAKKILALLVTLLVTVSVRESIRPAWANRGSAVRATRMLFFIVSSLMGGDALSLECEVCSAFSWSPQFSWV